MQHCAPLIREAFRRDLHSATALAARLDVKPCALFTALRERGAAAFALRGQRHAFAEGAHGATAGLREAFL